MIQMVEGGRTFAEISKEELKEISTRGGRNVTPKRMMAYKLIGLKRKISNGSITDNDVEYMISLMESPDASAFDIMHELERAKPFIDNDKYVDLKIKIHKMIYGEKKQIDLNLSGSVSINFGNVNLDKYKNDVVDAEFNEIEEDDSEDVNN